MARGRKTTPRSLANLRGEPGKRRRSSIGPIFETAIPVAPDYLAGRALEEWTELTQELNAKQIIAKVDQHIIAVYCQAVGRLHEVTNALKTQKMTIVSTRGISQVNPLLREENRLRQEIAKYASEIGITPTARNKIKTIRMHNPKPTPQQALAERLFRAKVKN